THDPCRPDRLPPEHPGEKRGEQRSGVVEQHAVQQGALGEVDEQGRLRAHHEADAQPLHGRDRAEAAQTLERRHHQQDQRSQREPYEQTEDDRGLADAELRERTGARERHRRHGDPGESLLPLQRWHRSVGNIRTLRYHCIAWAEYCGPPCPALPPRTMPTAAPGTYQAFSASWTMAST